MKEETFTRAQLDEAIALMAEDNASLRVRLAVVKAIAIDLAQKAYPNEADALNARRRIEAVSSK